MIGFGENDFNGISSMDMVVPLADRKSFVPPPLGNNSAAQISSSDEQQQRQKLSDLNMVLVDHNNNYNQHETFTVRAKIMAHPLFPRLLQAYLNCQKIGAPPEVVARLDEAYAKTESSDMAAAVRKGTASIGEDPALDQFMEAYCEMLIKYEQELSKPFKEAMLFFSRIDSQLKALAVTADYERKAVNEFCINMAIICK